MIQEVIMYGAACDRCNEKWYDEHNSFVAMSDKSTLKDSMDSDEWYVDDEKCYCPKCYEYGDDDEVIIKNLK